MDGRNNEKEQPFTPTLPVRLPSNQVLIVYDSPPSPAKHNNSANNDCCLIVDETLHEDQISSRQSDELNYTQESDTASFGECDEDESIFFSNKERNNGLEASKDTDRDESDILDSDDEAIKAMVSNEKELLKKIDIDLIDLTSDDEDIKPDIKPEVVDKIVPKSSSFTKIVLTNLKLKVNSDSKSNSSNSPLIGMANFPFSDKKVTTTTTIDDHDESLDKSIERIDNLSLYDDEGDDEENLDASRIYDAEDVFDDERGDSDFNAEDYIKPAKRLRLSSDDFDNELNNFACNFEKSYREDPKLFCSKVVLAPLKLAPKEQEEEEEEENESHAESQTMSEKEMNKPLNQLKVELLQKQPNADNNKTPPPSKFKLAYIDSEESNDERLLKLAESIKKRNVVKKTTLISNNCSPSTKSSNHHLTPNKSTTSVDDDDDDDDDDDGEDVLVYPTSPGPSTAEICSNQEEEKKKALRELFKERQQQKAQTKTINQPAYLDKLKSIKCKESAIILNDKKNKKKQQQSTGSTISLTQCVRLAKHENQQRLEKMKQVAEQPTTSSKAASSIESVIRPKKMSTSNQPPAVTAKPAPPQ